MRPAPRWAHSACWPSRRQPSPARLCRDLDHLADRSQIPVIAPWNEAKTLQRPLPDGSLRIVASGDKEDPALPF